MDDFSLEAVSEKQGTPIRGAFVIILAMQEEKKGLNAALFRPLEAE